MDKYVIHCDSHTERLVNIDNYLKKIFPDLKIWEGVYIDKISDEIIKNYDDNLDLLQKNNFVTLGEIGCYLSHHTLLKSIKEKELQDTKYTLILEDDVIFSKNFNSIISTELLDSIEFDILYLGGLDEKCRDKNIKNEIFTINSVYAAGTYGYIIKNSSAKKLYELTLNNPGTIDILYSKFVSNNTVTGLMTFPSVCIHDSESFFTTIHKENKRSRKKSNYCPKFFNNHNEEKRNFKNTKRIEFLLKSEEEQQEILKKEKEKMEKEKEKREKEKEKREKLNINIKRGRTKNRIR